MTAHEIWQQFQKKWNIQDLFWFVCKTWYTSFACDNLLYLAGKTKGFSHGPVKLSGKNSQEISAIRLNIQRQKTNKQKGGFDNQKWAYAQNSTFFYEENLGKKN